MRVETERSRNGYRPYSDRKYDERFRRKTYRYDDHHYHHHHHPSRHHHNEDYLLKRIANSPPSYSTDVSRFDRQTNNRDIYSSSLNDQMTLNGSPPPTDLYYIRERDSSTHYNNDTERNRYHQYPSPTNKSDQFKPSSRRESSSSSYRNEYRSSMDSYNELYRTSDYQNHSERYDISQNRTCSIATTSPVYYQNSSSYNTHDEYPSMREVDYRTRDYGLPTIIDHHPTLSNSSSNHYRSYRDRSSDLKRLRSNFRPMRR